MKCTFFCKNRKLVWVLSVVIFGVLLYVSAGSQVRYEGVLGETPCMSSSTKLAELSKDAIEDFIYNKEAIGLYEMYYAMEYAKRDYLYAYYDCDVDGRLELFLKKPEWDHIYSDVMKYEKNGLRDIYEWGMEKEIPVENLEWFGNVSEKYIETDKYGIDVYAEKSNLLNVDVYWYPDEESYLLDFGFEGNEPFYEYTDIEGNLRLVFYYDEQKKAGCGILYYKNRTAYGFAFHEIKEEKWESARDYYALETIDGDTNNDAEGYQEYYEYNDEGKVVYYESSGLYDIWGRGTGKERKDILQMAFLYDECGRLKQRNYWHNPHLFGTWYASWCSYFDELERVEYEYNYVTHGSREWFYIYADDSKKPAYVLMVDPGWGVEFVKYTE